MITLSFLRSLAISIVATAGSLSATAVVAAPPSLVPHIAAYTMQVSPSGSGGGMFRGRGVLQLEWRRDCEGMAYSQQSLLTLNSDEGAVFDSAVRIESWEAEDASVFRFLLESSIEGEVTEEVSGLAQRRKDGSVDVRYSLPAEQQRHMPAETVFPWQQTRSVLTDAAAGVRQGWYRLLRGEADGDPVGVSVKIVGDEGPPADRGALGLQDPADDLLPAQGWRVVSAYFENRVESVPAFEIAETMLASGVITRATIAYPDMTMRLKLQRLQRSAPPKCGE